MVGGLVTLFSMTLMQIFFLYQLLLVIIFNVQDKAMKQENELELYLVGSDMH